MVVGCADMMSSIIRQTIIQMTTPDEMRGRVFAVNALFVGTAGQLVTLPLLAPKINYDAFRDFASITKIVESPQVLFAHAKFPPNSLSELVTYAKQRPGAINYASVSIGGTGHLGMELLKQATGIDLLHVPYKGAAPATTDLISGRVQVMFSSLPSFLPHVKAGRVKILATGARKRTAAIPEAPAINETIPGYDLLTWYALFAPKRTPPEILREIHRLRPAPITGLDYWLARNPAAPVDVVADLVSSSRDPETIRLLSRHPRVSCPMLRTLAEHATPSVRADEILQTRLTACEHPGPAPVDAGPTNAGPSP